MARLQCQSCGGIYDDILADGMRYFHRCPSLSRVELAAAVASGAVKLPAGETVDVAIQRRAYERANLRDENVTGPARSKDAAAPIVSEGAGARELVPIGDPIQTVVVVPLPPDTLLPPV